MRLPSPGGGAEQISQVSQAAKSPLLTTPTLRQLVTSAQTGKNVTTGQRISRIREMVEWTQHCHEEAKDAPQVLDCNGRRDDRGLVPDRASPCWRRPNWNWIWRR